MKYYININQKAAIENFPDLDIIDLTIFEYIRSIVTSPSEDMLRINIDDKIYTWINYKKLLENMPLLKFKTPRSLRNHIENIVTAGLLERQIQNETLINKAYFRLLPKADLLIFDKNHSKNNIKSNKSPPHRMRKIPMRKQISASMRKPKSACTVHYNIKHNNNIKHNVCYLNNNLSKDNDLKNHSEENKQKLEKTTPEQFKPDMSETVLEHCHWYKQKIMSLHGNALPKRFCVKMRHAGLCEHDGVFCADMFNRFCKEILDAGFKNQMFYKAFNQKLKDLNANDKTWIYKEVKKHRNQPLTKKIQFIPGRE